MATSVVILVGVIVSILIHQLNNTDVFIYLGYGFHVVVAVADASPKPNTGLDQLLCAVHLPVKVRSLGGEWRAEPNLPLLLLVKALSVLHQMRPLLQAAAAGYAATLHSLLPLRGLIYRYRRLHGIRPPCRPQTTPTPRERANGY